MNGKRLLLILALLLLATPVLAQETRPDPVGTPTRVEAVIHVIDIRAIDSAQQNFTANVLLVLRWRDARLAHEGALREIRPLSEIWHPSPQFINREKAWTTFPDQVEVEPDGSVVFRQRYFGTFSERLDLRRFPFDDQTFSLEVVFSGSGPEEIQVVPHPDLPSGPAETLSLPDWQILGWSTKTSTHDPMPTIKGPVSFRLSIDASRSVGYYLFQVLMPLMLVLAMSWMVFWIDPSQSATQISVSVTATLTLIAYRFMVAQHVPRVAYLTRLDVIILGATLLVFVTLCEAVLTSALMRQGREKLARSIDRKARILWPLVLLLILVLARTA